MIRITLLRHAKTQGPAALNGSTDVPVPLAVQRELAAALNLLGFEHIITSPLRRCHDLAQQLQVLNPAMTLSVEDEFRELDFGDFDGQSFDALAPYWEQLEAFWRAPADNTLPGAETLQACQQRVTAAWQQWLPRLQDNTLVIAHGGTIRLLLAHILQSDWRNPLWYSSLAIGNQTLTRLTIFSAQPPTVSVSSIGIEVKDKPLN